MSGLNVVVFKHPFWYGNSLLALNVAIVMAIQVNVSFIYSQHQFLNKPVSGESGVWSLLASISTNRVKRTERESDKINVNLDDGEFPCLAPEFFRNKWCYCIGKLFKQANYSMLIFFLE